MEIDFGKPFLAEQLKPKDDFDEKVITFLIEWFSASKTVQVQTSGSTGTPKVFKIEKQKMLNSAEMTCNFLNLKPSDTALLCLPIEYISGKMMVVRSLLRKLKLTTTHPSTQPSLNENFDFCAMTPLQAEYSLPKINQIKNLILGGAAVSENLKQKLQQTNTRIFETYGMSETLSHIALKEINPNQEEYFSLFPGIKISQDERNCLNINAPQLNSQLLQTNDVVEIIDTDHFRFLGRADNVINSGGAKIYPEILEESLKREIQNELVFIGIPDETFGQKLILIVEESSTSTIENTASKDATLSRERKIIRDIVFNFPFKKSYFKPKEIWFFPKIPRTANGKVSRPKILDFCLNPPTQKK